MVNILIVGSGGREHAIGWKIAQSPKVDNVYFAPGNGGTTNNVDISSDDIEGLAKFAKENDCITVVGPEIPLSNGIVDEFTKKGLGIFGPTKNAAQLESSKIWAKNFMQRNGILTARFEVFDDPKKAIEFANSVDFHLVVKADGLAAGKGVIVCNSSSEAVDAINKMLVHKSFGNAGLKIILEERIDGVEASFIALSDGNIVYPMATSQDHKRIYDDDKGPNTGGMGTYSPTPVIDDFTANEIQKNVIEKTITSMKKEGIVFKGFLYAGIMLKDGKPYVLEFNARMGDPECQSIMMRMDSDLFKYVQASIDGTLSSLPQMSWKKQSAVCVILASKGYPESYPTGEEILGLDDLTPNSQVFHSGTRNENGRILTSGGRVLGVTAIGETLGDAIVNAYLRVGKISWPSKYCRTDIGKKGLTWRK
ncbi:MAG: phosphoribosylamine--glycine ligase [Thaumarchaeota archaeon]|nr:phosphoribosylamine--glycine ligase [Nitrososphaerota archaeon]MDE1830845.1 phosphoribosylamine--glycine ligase [Nitrososphaerota archaeon]MDE1840447.1 phosphoribosylamine--glycine ligase [Nitrososphaerota archaeon]MDE1876957.1 phosphoribosylamine--glycine ligase [Nitrososphaerota archaeon]